MTEVVLEAVSSESKPYRTFGRVAVTVMVNWQDGRAVKERNAPSPGSDTGETEQPERVKLAGVPCPSANVRAKGCVTGGEKFAVMLPEPRTVAVVDDVPADANVIPPASVTQSRNR
jgi:hypothetical protein